jgi:hypothetical protein
MVGMSDAAMFYYSISLIFIPSYDLCIHGVRERQSIDLSYHLVEQAVMHCHVICYIFRYIYEFNYMR